jgi:hypothetical protein
MTIRSRGFTVFVAVVCATALGATARADPAPPNVFDGAGVFVDNPLNFPGPWSLAAALETNHFTWVAFHVNNALAAQDLDTMWIDVFRAHGIAVGGWGTEDQHPLIDAVLADLAVRRYGFEAYYNQSRVYRPDLAIAHAVRAGWTPDRVHPVIGVYGRYPASRYVPLLQAAGARGFSVFLADQATAADYAALEPLAAATGLVSQNG